MEENRRKKYFENQKISKNFQIFKMEKNGKGNKWKFIKIIQKSKKLIKRK